MSLFRPSRSDNRLSTYWNALVRNAPAEELARLAANIEPSELAAIHRARAAHWRYDPDPVFARRLEQILMDTSISPVAGTIPQPRVSPPTTNGRHDRGRARTAPPVAWGRFGRSLVPALEIALIILLILASIAGIWLTTGRDDEPRIIVPPVATPEAEGTPTSEITPGPVTVYRGSPARNGVMPGPDIQGEPVLLWQETIGLQARGVPVVSDDTIYVTTLDGSVQARDIHTGDLKWSFVFDAAGLDESPVLANGLVFVSTTGTGAIFALDAETGELVWQQDDVVPLGSVIVVDGVLYSGGFVGDAYALDAATGEFIWTSRIVDPEAGPGWSLIAYDDGMIFAGTSQGTVVGLNTADGSIVWTHDTGNPALFTYMPVVANGVVYTGGWTVDGSVEINLLALDAKTGEVVWVVDRMGGSSQPAVWNDTLYFNMWDNETFSDIFAFDAQTGEELWRTTDSYMSNETPVIVDGTLYFTTWGDDDLHRLVAIDATTGETRWQFLLDEGTFFGPVVTGGVLYITTWNGSLYAITGSESGLVEVPAAAPATPEVAGSPEVNVATPATDELVPPFDLATMPVVWQSTGESGLSPEVCDLAIADDGLIAALDCADQSIALFGPDGAYQETIRLPGELLATPAALSQGPTFVSIGGIDFDADGNLYLSDRFNSEIRVYDRNWNLVTSWGREGSGDGEFRGPPRVTVDRANSIVYVADSYNHRVQVFDQEGNYLRQWGGFGVGQGRFVRPQTIAVAPDGTVWVVDEGNEYAQHFTPDGEFIGEFHSILFDGMLGGVFTMEVDEAGNLYTLAMPINAINVWSAEGALLASLTEIPGFGSIAVPRGHGFDANGNLVIAIAGESGVSLIAVELSPDTTPVATPVT